MVNQPKDAGCGADTQAQHTGPAPGRTSSRLGDSEADTKGSQGCAAKKERRRELLCLSCGGLVR